MNIFDICQNLSFRFNPYYLRGYIYIPLRLVIFLVVKIENRVFGQIQKTLDTKRARILEHNCKYILCKK